MRSSPCRLRFEPATSRLQIRHNHSHQMGTLSDSTELNKLRGRPPQYAPSPCNLTFDLLTLIVVSESRVTWATSVPISVFLGLPVLDLGLMYATDRRKRGAYCGGSPPTASYYYISVMIRLKIRIQEILKQIFYHDGIMLKRVMQHWRMVDVCKIDL